MKLSIDAASLRAACSRSLTETGATVQPILKHAHLRADNGALVFTTTDTEKMRADILPAEIKTAGMATCDVKRLQAALTAIEGSVGLELKQSHLALTLPGKRHYRLESLPPDDFPLWEADKAKPLPDLDPERLRFALARIAYAAGIKDARPQLNSLFIGASHLLATDGKLAAFLPATSGAPGILIPRGSFSALDEILGAAHDSISFELLETHHNKASAFRVRTPESSVTTRLLDYPFPEDGMLMYMRNKSGVRCTALMQTDDLLHALDRIRAFSEREGTTACIRFSKTDDGLRITPFFEDATFDTVEARFEGEGDFTGALHPDYLRRCIAFAKGKELNWGVQRDKGTHCSYFSAEGDADGHILMGVRE